LSKNILSKIIFMGIFLSSLSHWSMCLSFCKYYLVLSAINLE
jgi:hypothetical protein